MAIGPLIGAQVLGFASGHCISRLLVAIGVLLLAALFTLPRTLAPERCLAPCAQRDGELLRDRRILASAGIGGFFCAGAYAYMPGSPFAYISD